MRCTIVGCFLLFGFSFAVLPRLEAQAKKGEPRALLALPLAVKAGATTTITIRGLKLEAASEVLFPGSKVTAKILRKGKAAIPDKLPPEKVGDTEVVAEVTVPAGVVGPLVSFVIKTPAGQTKPHPLLLETTLPVLAESEPNNGFPQAQKVPLPVAVDGVIAQARDVDVFTFAGKAGQRVVFEVLAARYGSALDSLLTLYDVAGSELASNDDSGGSLDSRLEAVLPRDGVYYLSLMDAHDKGGPLHVYRLVGRIVK